MRWYFVSESGSHSGRTPLASWLVAVKVEELSIILFIPSSCFSRNLENLCVCLDVNDRIVMQLQENFDFLRNTKRLYKFRICAVKRGLLAA